jgi:diguanylate cyclase (GGDEF)-like protein
MGAIFLLRTPMSSALLGYASDGAVLSAWMTVISTESLLATISTAFILLAMAKERAELHQKIAVEKQAEQQIQYNSRHDGLTALANRGEFLARFNDELASARDGGYAVAMHHIDLDHFKTVNDTLGHPIGDQMLCVVAARLRRCVRSADILARLGGDEFGVIQILTKDKDDADKLARRLIDAIHEPYTIAGNDLIASASIGISVASGDGEDADCLMKNADIALHCAKAEGRHTYRYFEQQMDARLQSRRTLELDLRTALLRQEFRVTYQPIINLETDELTGFEALVRWHHPERGLVTPDEFIALAEDTKVILPLGDWVLWQACSDAAKWPRHLTLAVNLSPIQFKKSDLAQCVARALASAGISAKRLELEITESALLQHSESTLDTLRQLRNTGVRIVMDDFGVGHSSLGYLCKFPFDGIKIDRTFVKALPQNAECLAIVRAAVGIASSMRIAATAEGVETPEQLEQVRAEGCTSAQGFLFSPSMSASECEAFMSRYALVREAFGSVVTWPRAAAAGGRRG